ncbi:MAG: DUF1566 domain-containing protein, partial [Planctomycetes bacterium]|nr:DUF1566 domain-containing protein [Planctomycetota bacterium]
LIDGFCTPPEPLCELDPKFGSGFADNGATYYEDRSYVITEAGPFAGMTMIKTLNDDRNSTMPTDYLNYEVTEDGYLYVAYDRRATTPPDWLTTTLTQIPCAKIETSLSSQGWFDVYKREVSSGECVRLGGNKGPGFSGGTVSNYMVMFSTTNVGDQCPPPEAVAPVAQTGQKTKYEPGDDGDTQRGVASPSPRFTDNSDGTIRDNLTGKIWTADANLNAGTATWANALTFCNGLSAAHSGLDDSSVAGDWALANKNELYSLTDASQSYPALPSDHTSYFTNVQTDWYWSATTVVATPTGAWTVHIGTGDVGYDVGKGTNRYVWCVRGGP